MRVYEELKSFMTTRQLSTQNNAADVTLRPDTHSCACVFTRSGQAVEEHVWLDSEILNLHLSVIDSLLGVKR